MIQAQRMLIRPFTPQDLPALTDILIHAETMRFWPKPFTSNQVQNWLERSLKSYAENGFGRYALILKDSEALIGDAGLLLAEVDGSERVDLGYIIHAPY